MLYSAATVRDQFVHWYCNNSTDAVFASKSAILMSPLFRTLVPAFLSLLLAASGNAGDWSSIEVGYQGVGKVGKWLPVNVAASEVPAGQQVELQAAFTDPRGDTCVQTVATGTADKAGEISLSGYFCVGRLEGRGELSLVSSEGDVLCRQVIIHGAEVNSSTIDATKQTLRSSLKLYKLDAPILLTIGEVAGIEELLRNTELMSQNRTILKTVNVPNASELTEDIRGLDIVDMLLVVTDFNANEKQTAAIREWVESGGDFYCSVGANVSDFVTTDIGRWMNQHFQIAPEAVTIRDLSALQSFVPGGSRLETGRRPVPMAVASSSQSAVQVNFLNGPLVSSQSAGAGTVTFVAVDLNQRPVDRWLSLPQFYEMLLFGEKLSQTTGVSSRSSRISQSGVSDLATQLMASVDAVPAAKWTTWSILAAMAGWLLLIGPIDYLLVTRVLKRPHMTWLTFPLLIGLGVAFVVWSVGNDKNNTLNQLHLVDIFPGKDASHVHTRSWMSLSSAQTARIELAATPELFAGPEVSSLLMWAGRPEDVYGGMYRAGGIGLGRQKYSHRIDAPNQLSQMPMLTDGSRQLTAEWRNTLPQQIVESTLTASGYGLLKGSFTHSLPEPLEDFIIVHGNRVYRTITAGDDQLSLPAGQPWEARSQQVAASDIKAYLNGQRLIKSDEPTRRGSSRSITPYNTKSDDPMYIMAIATFYDISGGSNYVGLSQEYLRDMELSDTIKLNHAVLIGVTRTPATRLATDGTDVEPNRSQTLVRMLLPVLRNPAEEMAPTSSELEQREARENSEADKEANNKTGAAEPEDVD